MFKSGLKYEKLAVAFSVILLLLVCFTGFWVYSKLSSVTDEIAEERMKDSRLLKLKELSNDLVAAENCAYSYTITQQDTLLKIFHRIRQKSEFEVRQLRNIPSSDKSYIRYIDTLETLVNQRFVTLEELVLVQNENRVNDAMEQVIHEVKSMTRPGLDTPVKVPDAKDRKEKRNLFEKLLEAKRAKKAKKQKPAINSANINAGLVAIKKDVVQEEQSSNARKLAVEQRNNRLIARFTALIQLIENQEKRAVLIEAQQTKKVARETNIIIALFCLTSVVLIIFTSYLLVLFLGKTRATTTQLLVAKQKSDQLTRSKSQFLANMSHELRTPLNAIVGFTEQLRNGDLPEEEASKVAIISKAADHLTRITNEILDFSKLSAGAVRLETIPFSLREEVGFVVTTLQQLADDNRNALETRIDDEIPKVVVGDPMRVRQILINLIGNALKFTENGKVTVSVKSELLSTESVTVLLKVSDTGIGISEENIARIFDEFEQAETSVTRKFGGTGLGLSITRMLVERMSGKIGVQSKPGKGTEFEISLPFGIGTELQPETKTKKEGESLKFLKGKSVLVVDDESYNRKLLKAHLEKTGVRISEAANGQEALEAISRNAYDLVLLDLRMPVMDGFATLKAIRKLKSTMSSVPVIALTAAVSQEERLTMVRDSWSGVLLKPFKENEFRKIVSKVMNQEPSESETEIAAEPAATSWNLNSLKDISADDKAFYLDMLQTLYQTTEEGLNIISDAAAAKDWLAAAEAAHKIAAPIRHMEANEVYENLKAVETAGRKGEIGDETISRIVALKTQLAEILKFIDSEISKANADEH
jgi:signal transduction histidine kinase/CheY-like chemotaxis protein/HPt (histidine-containing phosphotransfer) domain-containing protein